MRYEDYRRRKQSGRRFPFATVAAVIVIIAALIAIAVVVISLIPRSSADQQAQPAATETAQPTLYLPDQQGDAAATQAPAATSPAPVIPDATTVADTPSATVPPAATLPDAPEAPDAPTAADSGSAYADAPQSGSSAEIDGALHYYASGSTTEGYRWTYGSDGEIVAITCKYLFETGQYDFIITGTSPGVTSFYLKYYTDDENFVTVPMTVSVDDNLAVTRIN